MGNSLHGASLLSNDVYFPYHIQLGRYAAIDIDENPTDQPETNPGVNRLILPSYMTTQATTSYENPNYWPEPNPGVNRLILPSHMKTQATTSDENPNHRPEPNPGVNRLILPSHMKTQAMWTMSYDVDGSKCRLKFEKYFFENHKVNKVSLSIHDDICSGAAGIHLTVTKGENNVLELDTSDPYFCFSFCGDFFGSCNTQFNSNNNTLGVVTETTVIDYGSGWKGGHVIIEKKKKSKDEKPYMVTLAHYYAVSNGIFFRGSKIDIGLSTIVKIQVSNGSGLDIKIEGPVQHPVTALFYMFDEVRKTGIWKPTFCPHCAKIQKMQRNWLQTESEDSDNFPPTRHNYPKHIGKKCCCQ